MANRRSGAADGDGTDAIDTDPVKADILDVATREFADRGFAGARVDEIAAKTLTSKRMIYYHFGGKDGLYRAVLTRAYTQIRMVEATAGLDLLPPLDALARMVEITLDFHADHPDFVRLVMDENMRCGGQIETFETIRGQNASIVSLLADIVARGVAAGVMRPGLDALRLHLMISALAFHPVSNRYTVASNFQYDMAAADSRAAHCLAVTEMILRFCRADPVSADPD